MRIIRDAEGFTLIEALISMALMGMVLTGLALITSQWLPGWNRGFVRLQRNELIDLTLDRLVADLSAAEFITPNRETKNPLFDGRELSVTFVRSALGPNTRPGLQVVRIAETADQRGAVLVRSQAQFVPSDRAGAGAAPFNFANPAPLLRAPYRVSFAYAGREGGWQSTWQGQAALPAAVRLTVRDVATERVLAVSTTASVHVDLPAICVQPQSLQDCITAGLFGAAAASAPNQPASPARTGGG